MGPWKSDFCVFSLIRFYVDFVFLLVIIRPHRSVDESCNPVVTDRVLWSFSLLLVSPAKTAEPIEMPFGLWAQMGPRNHDREMLRDVVMATNFGTKTAITGFVRMIATRQLVMGEGFEWLADRLQTLPIPCT